MGVDVRPASDFQFLAWLGGPPVISTFTNDAGYLTTAPAMTTGVIVMWPSDVIPAGWKLCNAEYLLKAAYPDLYAVIGVTFGGDALGFNLPSLVGRVDGMFVKATGSGETTGSEGGSTSTNTGYASVGGETDSGYAAVTDSGHSHQITSGSTGDNVVGNAAFCPDYPTTTTDYANLSDAGHAHDVSGLSDSGHNHDGVMPLHMRLNFIIKT